MFAKMFMLTKVFVCDFIAVERNNLYSQDVVHLAVVQRIEF